jgi:uncharacterized protein YaiI (UPF0178 family)
MAAEINCLLEGVQAVGSDEGQFYSENKIRIQVYERRTPWPRRKTRRKTRRKRAIRKRRSKFAIKFQVIRRIQHLDCLFR